MQLQSRRAKRDVESAQCVSKWLSTVSDDELAQLQWQSLCRVWADCIANVPHYRDLVRSGRAPSILQGWKDLGYIPVLNRETLRERQSEFQRISRQPDETRMTGGSTGVPVRIGVW